MPQAPPRGKIIGHLREAFPKEFFAAVVAILREVYAETSASEAAKVTGYRRRFVVGVKRFAYVEERVLRLASIYKVRDISISEEKGVGNAVHVEIRSGRFVLTLAFVKRPDQFVRISKYREGLAVEYQQALFPKIAEEPVGEEYYGILIHGPAETASGLDYSRPGFLKVAFPNQDFNGYATEHLDVLALYNIPLAPVVVNNTERIPDNARPRLKTPPSDGEET